MRLAIVALILGLAACLSSPCVPARASEPEVSPALVCAVQAAIRWREAAWAPEQCARVAGAISTMRDPVTVLAIAVNESDLRPTAIAKAGPDVYDVGLLGVRCRVREGKCSEGPTRGYTVAQLMDPMTNIAVAGVVIALKRANGGRHWLRHYNGGTREHGYAASIEAIRAALGGVLLPGGTARIRKLTRQIVAAVKPRIAMAFRKGGGKSNGAAVVVEQTLGTFGTYMGKLRSLELVTGRGQVQASAELFG